MSESTNLHSHSPVRTRNSSIELLRLVCMFFILMHHFLVHGLNLGGYSDVDIPLEAGMLNSSYIVNTFFTGMTIVFILISGYFGIRLRFKNVFALFCACAFYGLIGYLVHLYIDQSHLECSIIKYTLFIFSHSSYWFIEQYACLLCVSPLLNYAIEHMNKANFRRVIWVLLFMNLYFGYFWKNNINPSGHSHAHFILLYLIGRYLRLHANLSNVKQIRIFAIFLFFGGKIIASSANYLYHTGVLSEWLYVRSGEPTLNNPFLLAAALGTLLFFLTFHFSSKLVNYCSASALAIYLITENKYVGRILYGFVPNITAVSNHIPAKYMLLIGAAIICMIGCLAIDKIRLLIMTPIMQPIENWADKKGWNNLF